MVMRGALARPASQRWASTMSETLSAPPETASAICGYLFQPANRAPMSSASSGAAADKSDPPSVMASAARAPLLGLGLPQRRGGIGIALAKLIEGGAGGVGLTEALQGDAELEHAIGGLLTLGIVGRGLQIHVGGLAVF